MKLSGKCFWCAKKTNSVNDLIGIGDGYYCSTACGLLALLDKKEALDNLIRRTIEGTRR